MLYDSREIYLGARLKFPGCKCIHPVAVVVSKKLDWLQKLKQFAKVAIRICIVPGVRFDLVSNIKQIRKQRKGKTKIADLEIETGVVFL